MIKQIAKSEAMKGKPGRNPNGRPVRKIELILDGTDGENVTATLIVNGKTISGDRELLEDYEKRLKRGRK